MSPHNYAPLAGFVDLLLDAICVVDREGRYLYVSAAYERIFGYRPDEVVGKPVIDLVAPEDRESTLLAARQIMSGDLGLHFENRYIRKDGQIVHIMWSARWSEEDQVRIAIAHDITRRKQAEARQALLYSISEAAHGADDLLDLFRQIHLIIGIMLPAHRFAVALRDEKSGQLNFPYHADQFGQEQAAELPAVEAFAQEVVANGQPLLRASANLVPVSGQTGQIGDWLGVPLSSQHSIAGALILKELGGGRHYTDADKELMQFVSTQVATAVERKQLYRRLQHMAQYDDLTGLANRALLQDRLKTALARAKREQGRVSLLYLDLNGFKQVNDTYGHAVGDLLLQEVARRLTQCVRASDTVARIGGDEFVVLLENLDLPEHAELVAQKIRAALCEPLLIDQARLDMLPSIGTAHYPDHGEDSALLLKHADAGMYQEKSLSRASQRRQGAPVEHTDSSGR